MGSDGGRECNKNLKTNNCLDQPSVHVFFRKERKISCFQTPLAAVISQGTKDQAEIQQFDPSCCWGAARMPKYTLDHLPILRKLVDLVFLSNVLPG